MNNFKNRKKQGSGIIDIIKWIVTVLLAGALVLTIIQCVKLYEKNKELPDLGIYWQTRPPVAEKISTYQNIRIGDHEYSKISIRRAGADGVRILELKTPEDTLYIPDHIGSFKVTSVGAYSYEIPEYQNYIKENRTSPILAQLCWQQDPSTPQKIVIAEGVSEILPEAFEGVDVDSSSALLKTR